MAAATSTLQTIRTKVRRLTRSPSVAQLSDADLDQYINTSILFDIPTKIKFFSLRTVFSFYTQPGVDVYRTNTTDPNDPLYDFPNKYTAVHPPVYLAGVPGYYTQERDVFYGNFPRTNFISDTGLLGDGTTGTFSGIINTFAQSSTSVSSNQFILQNSVVFTALDTAGTAMILKDYPVSNLIGALGIPGVPQTLPSPYGQINYRTGEFTLNFPSATAVSSVSLPNPIWSEIIPYIAGIPTTMLYYNNEFTLRPVPDKAYVVEIEANVVPTQLLQTTDHPQIKQWWQWIAFIASFHIFEDRVDDESIAKLQSRYDEQESLALSTSMEQYANERTVTAYTNNSISNGWNNFGRWPY